MRMPVSSLLSGGEAGLCLHFIPWLLRNTDILQPLMCFTHCVCKICFYSSRRQIGDWCRPCPCACWGVNSAVWNRHRGARLCYSMLYTRGCKYPPLLCTPSANTIIAYIHPGANSICHIFCFVLFSRLLPVIDTLIWIILATKLHCSASAPQSVYALTLCYHGYSTISFHRNQRF